MWWSAGELEAADVDFEARDQQVLADAQTEPSSVQTPSDNIT